MLVIAPLKLSKYCKRGVYSWRVIANHILVIATVDIIRIACRVMAIGYYDM